MFGSLKPENQATRTKHTTYSLRDLRWSARCKYEAINLQSIWFNVLLLSLEWGGNLGNPIIKTDRAMPYHFRALEFPTILLTKQDREMTTGLHSIWPRNRAVQSQGISVHAFSPAPIEVDQHWVPSSICDKHKNIWNAEVCKCCEVRR